MLVDCLANSSLSSCFSLHDRYSVFVSCFLVKDRQKQLFGGDLFVSWLLWVILDYSRLLSITLDHSRLLSITLDYSRVLSVSLSITLDYSRLLSVISSITLDYCWLIPPIFWWSSITFRLFWSCATVTAHILLKEGSVEGLPTSKTFSQLAKHAKVALIEWVSFRACHVLYCSAVFLMATTTIQSSFCNDTHEPADGTICLAKFTLFESFSFATSQGLASLVLFSSFCVCCILDLLIYSCIWAREEPKTAKIKQLQLEMASNCLRIAWKSPKIAKDWMITGQERHYFAYSWFALKVKEVLSWRFSHDRRQDLAQYFFDKIWKTCLAILCWICFTKQKDNHKKAPIFVVQSGTDLRQDLAVLSQKGCCDGTGHPQKGMNTSTWSCESCQNYVKRFYLQEKLIGGFLAFVFQFLVLIFRLRDPTQLCIRIDEPANWAPWLAENR